MPRSGRHRWHKAHPADSAVVSDPKRAFSILFDDVVGASEHHCRHGETQCFGGLEIDHQLEFCRLLDRQIGRLDALQDFLHESGAEPKRIGTIDAVSHECADFGKGPRHSGDRQAVLECEIDDASSWQAGLHDDRVRSLFLRLQKCRIELIFAAHCDDRSNLNASRSSGKSNLLNQ